MLMLAAVPYVTAKSPLNGARAYKLAAPSGGLPIPCRTALRATCKQTLLWCKFKIQNDKLVSQACPEGCHVTCYTILFL